MPDDVLQSNLVSLDIFVPNAPRSLAPLVLDRTDRLRLMATGTKEPVFDLVRGRNGLVLTLHGDGGEQVFDLPWLGSKLASDSPVRVRADPDANGYMIEVPAVVSKALPNWTRSGHLYSAAAEPKGPRTVFRPRRETPK